FPAPITCSRNPIEYTRRCMSSPFTAVEKERPPAVMVRYLPASKLITQSCPKKVHTGLIPANIKHDQLSALEEVRSCHPGWLTGANGSAIGTHSPCVSISRRGRPVLKHLQSFPIDIYDSAWHGEKGLGYFLPGDCDSSATTTKLFNESNHFGGRGF
ncbi:MAG: hypothetical protein ABI923_01935, partial [bacterium]